MTKEKESAMKQQSELTQIELDQPATPSSPAPQQAPPIQQVQPFYHQTPPNSQLTTPNPHNAPPTHQHTQPPNVGVPLHEPQFSVASQMSSPNRQQPRYLPQYAVSPNQQLQQQQQQILLMQPYQVNTAAPIGTQQYHQPRSQALATQPASLLYSPVIPEACRYKAKSAKTLGILQIIAAVMFVILGVIAIVVGQWISEICVPIWTAFFFYLPAGILGVISAKPTNMQNCVISSCTAMSCLATIAALGTGIVMIISAFNDFFLQRGNVVIDTLIALLALGEVIIAIMQMIYCCRAPNKCCGTKTIQEGQYAPQVYYTTPYGQTVTPVARYPAQVTPQQQQRSNYYVQSTVPLQTAPLVQQTMRSPNSGEYNQDFLMNPNVNDEDLPQLPKYSDSPPPCYSSLANM